MGRARQSTVDQLIRASGLGQNWKPGHEKLASASAGDNEVSSSQRDHALIFTRKASQLVRTMSIASTLVHRAEIRFHEAADALRPFVGCFWVVTAERDATIRVVPDGSTAISVQLQRGQPSEWVLRGPLVRPDERRLNSSAVLIGIRLPFAI